MGCSISAEETELRRSNKQIELALSKEREQRKGEVKILLLGAGESGKSTILKQMTLIHGSGYSRAERESYKDVIFSNTIQSMKVVVMAMRNLGIPFSNSRSPSYVSVIEGLPPQSNDGVLPPEIAIAIRGLYCDPGVRLCIDRASEFQLNDSSVYYFEAIDRLAMKEYVPTDQDILRSRIKTTGITETTFHVGRFSYRMIDVGGQRSERKKWIHCFENVTAIVFLVAISEYDQVLVEDETVNRIDEALVLFESICNSRWFTNTSIILFLNKIDLFKNKLSRTPLHHFMDDYYGDSSYESASDYMLRKFISLHKTPNKQIYPHFTCATDTTQVKFVMAAVNDILIQAALRESGLLL